MALTKITSNLISNNTIAVTNIADNAIDATKIASNSILTRHIDDNQITEDQIADDAVTSAKLDTNIAIGGTLDVTGNITGTLATAAQPNITSVGSLTALDVTGTATMDGLTVDDGGVGTATDLIKLKSGWSSPSGLKAISFEDQSGNTLGQLGVSYSGGVGSFEIDSLYNSGNNSNKVFKASAGGDISFYEDTGSTAKFFWDASAESLGIGTDSPDSKLHVFNNTNTVNNVGSLGFDVSASIGNNATNPGNHYSSGIRIFQGSGSVGSGLGVFNIGVDNGTALDANRYTAQLIAPSGMTGGISLSTGGSNRMRIDASGNVGIGTTSPSKLLTIGSPTTANTTARLNCSTTAGSDIGMYSFGIDDTTDFAGIKLDFSERATHGLQIFTVSAYGYPITLSTTGSQDVLLDTSGNLLVGTTDSTVFNNTTGSGVVLSSNGQLQVAGESTPLYLNRQGTDGTLTNFSKNGTTVGSIGVASGALVLGNGNAGLYFNSSLSTIMPWGITGNTNRDAAIDIGQSANRFKDLYLSGGALTTTVKFLANSSVSGSDATIFRPADNTMAFSTNGAERMRIDSDGVVYFGPNGSPRLTVEAGKQIQRMENGFVNSGGMYRTCLGGFGHHTDGNPGSSGTGTYMHFKTNVPKNNTMFRFEYRGYGYNANNIDTSICGYTYEGTSYVYSPVIQDTGDTAFNFKTPYYSSDSKLVLVLQIANNYTGGVMWAQFVGSHTIAGVAITSTKFSTSTTGAY